MGKGEGNLEERKKKQNKQKKKEKKEYIIRKGQANKKERRAKCTKNRFRGNRSLDPDRTIPALANVLNQS